MLKKYLFLFFISLIYSSSLYADDWPTYQGNSGRHGLTSEKISENLNQSWSHRLRLAPDQAWPKSKRLIYDKVCHPIIADNTIFIRTRDQLFAIAE